jgi:putative transposase
LRPVSPERARAENRGKTPNFFAAVSDYAAHLELMAQWWREEGVEIWGYGLMPNHAHLTAVPAWEHGLRRAVGEAHRLYTRRINFREKWRGYPLENATFEEYEVSSIQPGVTR